MSQVFTSGSATLGSWNYRLNFDTNSFINEIRITDEGTF